MTARRRCPRCQGLILFDRDPEGDQWCCLNCGHRYSVRQLEPLELVSNGNHKRKYEFVVRRDGVNRKGDYG